KNPPPRGPAPARPPADAAVPRRDCSASRGRAGNRTGGDHHAARRLADEQEHLAWERALEAPPGLDRRADDNELGSTLGRDAGYLVPQAPRTRPHDHPPHTDARPSR